MGNHGIVRHTVCMLAVQFVFSAGEMEEAGETWPGLI